MLAMRRWSSSLRSAQPISVTYMGTPSALPRTMFSYRLCGYIVYCTRAAAVSAAWWRSKRCALRDNVLRAALAEAGSTRH